MRRTIRQGVLIFTAVCLVTYLVAQEQVANTDTPVVHVVPLETSGSPVPTELPMGSIFGSTHCDRDGQAYIRLSHGTDSPMQSPVIRLSQDGSKLVRFDYRDAGLTGAVDAIAFAVDPGGHVYQIVHETTKDDQTQYLLSYGNDGSFGSKTRMKTLFDPYVFVALKNERFLVSGMLPAKDGFMQSITAIVKADGEVVRDLKSSDDDKGYQKVPDTPGAFNRTIQGSDAQLGPDDNIYLMKGSTPARVEVFSQEGKKLRTLNLVTPLKDARAWEMQVSGQAILVHYQGPREVVDPVKNIRKAKVVIGMYNLQTGDLMYAYDPSAIKGIMMCYAGDKLTFFSLGNNAKFSVLTATLK